MLLLPRNIVLLGLVSLFTDLSSQMVFPLIPLYLTHVLGAGGLIVGIVEGAAEATASLLKVWSGFISDKIHKRKPFILFGYSLSSILKPLFAVSGSWAVILIVRIMERIGKGLRNAPRDAFIADHCPPEIRGRAFGFHRMMDGAGSLLGSLTAWYLLGLTTYQNIFYLSVVPAVLAVGTILLVKEEKVSPADSNHTIIAWNKIKLPPDLLLFLLAASIFSFGHFGYSFFLLKASGISDRTAILLYTLFYAVYTLFSYPAGMLADKIGKKWIVFSGYTSFAVVCYFMLYANDMAGLVTGFVLYGIFFAAIDGSQRTYIAEMSPPHLRGTSLGLFHTMTGIAALPGGMAAGWLWDNTGQDSTFIFGGGIALLSTLLFITAAGLGKKKNSLISS